jgi:hypothetical protein
MAAKLTRRTHKIAIQLHLVAESCTICSSRSRRPVRKLLDTSSYSIFPPPLKFWGGRTLLSQCTGWETLLYIISSWPDVQDVDSKDTSVVIREYKEIFQRKRRSLADLKKRNYIPLSSLLWPSKQPVKPHNQVTIQEHFFFWQKA